MTLLCNYLFSSFAQIMNHHEKIVKLSKCNLGWDKDFIKIVYIVN